MQLGYYETNGDGVKIPMCGCGKEGVERYSLGIYAGLFCDVCWNVAGYRKEGPEGFDPLYAGETYKDDC